MCWWSISLFSLRSRIHGGFLSFTTNKNPKDRSTSCCAAPQKLKCLQTQTNKNFGEHSSIASNKCAILNSNKYIHPPNMNRSLTSRRSIHLNRADSNYWDADKSLARPGRKQARKHVRRRARFQQHRDASCHQVFFPARQGVEDHSRHSGRNISLFPSWSG